jgi:hypothetical protein
MNFKFIFGSRIDTRWRRKIPYDEYLHINNYLKRIFITLHKIMVYLPYMQAFKFRWEEALFNYVYRIIGPPSVLERFLLIELYTYSQRNVRVF